MRLATPDRLTSTARRASQRPAALADHDLVADDAHLVVAADDDQDANDERDDDNCVKHGLICVARAF